MVNTIKSFQQVTKNAYLQQVM